MSDPTVNTTPYTLRAASLVLLWTELTDEVGPAEDCASVDELHQRRDDFRRAMVDQLQRAAETPRGLSAKQIQRYFFNQPPAGGVLPFRWKTTLLDTCLAGLPRGESNRDVDLAVRGLFVDGDASLAELCRRRPKLVGAVESLLVGVGKGPVANAAAGGAGATARFTVAQLITQASLPMAVLDAAMDRIVEVNHAFEQFYALSRTTLVGWPVAEMTARAAQLSVPDLAPAYRAQQPDVIDSSLALGCSEIVGVVDFSRRSWAPGARTPPFEGVAKVRTNVHEVLDGGGARACFLLIYHVVPWSGERRAALSDRSAPSGS